ncbi:hypothetical protein Dda_9444 [Drechslerella dactyloides]|uniref:Uncharacterized protein n=1 Tax=Drechslerella dactyloides TaxID=74499 RepID=A0AAD6NF49_DREDA|nr:hypothetical protein Dda_9444 [Drechslerella dactyloides]
MSTCTWPDAVVDDIDAMHDGGWNGLFDRDAGPLQLHAIHGEWLRAPRFTRWDAALAFPSGRPPGPLPSTVSSFRIVPTPADVCKPTMPWVHMLKDACGTLQIHPTQAPNSQKSQI